MPLQDTPKLPLSTSVSSSRLSLAYLIYLIQRVRSYRRSLLDAKLSRARPRQTWQSRRYALSRSRTARRASGRLIAFNWVGACTRRTASRPGPARPRCRQPQDCSTAVLQSCARSGWALLGRPAPLGGYRGNSPRVRAPSKRFICCSLQSPGNPCPLVLFPVFGNPCDSTMEARPFRTSEEGPCGSS